MTDRFQARRNPQAFSTLRRLGFVLVVFLAVACPSSCFAQRIQIFTLSGPGITQDASCPAATYDNCYTLNLGTVDALGVNTSATLTEIASTSPYGEIYASNAYANVQVGSKYNGQQVAITGTVTTPFTHSLLLTGKACSSGCGAATSFTSLSATTTTLFNGIEGPSTLLNVGALVSELNGAGTYTGSDTEIITLAATSGNHDGTIRLTINVGQVQTAISASLTGFSTGSSTDYLYNFATLNGLGVGSAASQQCTATLCPSATLPAVIYFSPQYTYTARFANFASTTGTLTAYASNFSTSAQGTLKLCDAATTTGPCNALPSTSTSALSLSTLNTRGSTSRNLGLIVAEKNGTGAFTGNATATITYTFTVQ